MGSFPLPRPMSLCSEHREGPLYSLRVIMNYRYVLPLHEEECPTCPALHLPL